ncbi:dynein light chain Tctex-type 5-like [Acropora millepora]|uniref:dynein light chain Tctex-type 5-like n=1 Tax=Acropora millepora TaxID=45264 RepID=UPI001CF33923|nr:dynein light chain Tctex-type 5-like [Acropora millepora]
MMSNLLQLFKRNPRIKKTFEAFNKSYLFLFRFLGCPQHPSSSLIMEVFEPQARVLSFQSVSDDVSDYAKSLRRASGSSVASLKQPTPRRGSKAVGSYVSPYRLWRQLSDGLPEKQNAADDEVKKSVVENTYRTKPKQKFPEREVEEIIRSSLQDMLKEQIYSAMECGFLTKLLSSRIMERVKSLNIERYKLVCLVNVGSKHNQGIRVASRCLWNEEVDTQATASVENGTLFAVATVFGIYFE